MSIGSRYFQRSCHRIKRRVDRTDSENHTLAGHPKELEQLHIHQEVISFFSWSDEGEGGLWDVGTILLLDSLQCRIDTIKTFIYVTQLHMSPTPWNSRACRGCCLLESVVRVQLRKHSSGRRVMSRFDKTMDVCSSALQSSRIFMLWRGSHVCAQGDSLHAVTVLQTVKVHTYAPHFPSLVSLVESFFQHNCALQTTIPTGPIKLKSP
ncbi:MAG: hypothetical protein J3Q66DRAFT_358007 [Benniella sp.]|nr:MAG: hypothetical protein J3Q66DRAFT_358007 [Benniella sp.]